MVALSRSIRYLVEALAANRSPAQADLDVLIRLAAHTVGGEHEDIVGDFLLTTLEATRAGRAASAHRLLDLPDLELVAAVRHRIRQHHHQSLPSRRLFRAIRSHVAKALDCSAILDEPIAPVSLWEGERLSGSRVSEATYHLLTVEPAMRRSPALIAARLMAMYCARETQEPEEVAHADSHARLDACENADALRMALGPELVRLIKHRQRGLSLSRISKLEGMAVSTAHARFQEALGRLRERISRDEMDFETGRVAIDLVAA